MTINFFDYTLKSVDPIPQGRRKENRDEHRLRLHHHPHPHRPAAKVWQAWTDADQYGQWASAEEVVLDVRPGGAWSSVMVIPGGARIPLSGTYTEVVQNKHLVLGMNVPGRTEPVLMHVDLAADGEGSTLTLSQTFDTAEDRDQAEQGSNFLLDSLTTFLA